MSYVAMSSRRYVQMITQHLPNGHSFTSAWGCATLAAATKFDTLTEARQAADAANVESLLGGYYAVQVQDELPQDFRRVSVAGP